ncbi:MAG: carboxylating nicotinate-nucleotide diphosphorylase [Myxococcota bacterium]|nr:carboxylating nicotinate-nucleotide diphosphorylase [Myxococcota bacterium]
MFELWPIAVERIIKLSLDEDLSSGDPTTEACVPSEARAVAHAVTREPLVACGGLVFARVFALVDPTLTTEMHVADGERADVGTRLWTVRGRARPILMAERVALNLTARMCGVATKARSFVDAVPRDCRARITDTRKTTPGLRALERYAVRVGGARNHRDDLGAGVLIKDNHVAACGSVRAAIERARAMAPHVTKIECEVDSLAQLDEAIAAGADIVLLDNMSTTDIAQAVKRARGTVLLEASGGVTLDRVAELARTGIDAISVGALTHSAAASNVSLEFQ